MGQPRRLRTRKVVESDEENDSLTRASPSFDSISRVTTLASRAKNTETTISPLPEPAVPRSATPITDVKPEKPKSNAKTKVTQGTATGKAGSKTILSFFNAETQKQQSGSVKQKTIQPEASAESGDDIHDDIPGREGFLNKREIDLQGALLGSRKRRVESSALAATAMQNGRTTQTGLKFLKRVDGCRVPGLSTKAKSILEADTRAWAEKYGPKNMEELVVHKKKISDVRQWLQGSILGDKHKRLLVLKGASGTGKSTTLKLLSQGLGYEIVEWRNPVASDFSSAEFVSISSHFDDFLNRGRRFASLEIVSTSASARGHVARPLMEDSSVSSPQVLLVEEFPANIHPATMASQFFRSSIMQVLSAPTMPNIPPTPVVLIVSESVLSGSASPADNFTAHRLLGPEILHHPRTTVMEFNAVAPSFMHKAFTLVLQKRSRDIGYHYSPQPDLLKRIAELGDLRSATTALELLCLNNGSPSSERIIPGEPLEKRMRKPTMNFDDSAEAELAVPGFRESSIGLFHAVGRVVYNKRSVDASTNDTGNTSQQPEPLVQQARRPVSVVNTETLMEETGTDSSTFVSALHENYISSCYTNTGPDCDLDAINGCLDALCDADILSNIGGSMSGQMMGSSESLRQSELAFQVAVQGMLFSLPFPVKRRPIPGKGKADAHRMFYPTSLKLWRKREEMSDLLGLLTCQAIAGNMLGHLQLWSRRETRSRAWPDHKSHETQRQSLNISEAIEEDATMTMGSGISATQEMLTERLPYLIEMLPRNQSYSSLKLIKQIEQVTRFTGVRMQSDDDEYDDTGTAFVSVTSTDFRNRNLSFLGELKSGTSQGDLNEDKLILSDDDIEDD